MAGKAFRGVGVTAMDEEADFLGELQSHPNDDATRLLYAEWLDGRGDPRGRFLRLEVALAELSRQDPYGTNPQLAAGRARAETELRALEAGLDRQWLASVARVVRFHCAGCGLPVTGPLRRLVDDRHAAAVASGWRRGKRGGDLVPQGYYWVAPAGHPLDLIEAGHHCLNLRDLINTRHHPDPERLKGCCGMGGLGPNTVCLCGREIGTECTDCNYPCRYFELVQPFGFFILEAEE